MDLIFRRQPRSSLIRVKVVNQVLYFYMEIITLIVTIEECPFYRYINCKLNVIYMKKKQHVPGTR